MQGKYASHYTIGFAWPVTYNSLYVWCVSENQGKKMTCHRESNPHLSFSCRVPYRFGYHNGTLSRKQNQVKTTTVRERKWRCPIQPRKRGLWQGENTES